MTPMPVLKNIDTLEIFLEKAIKTPMARGRGELAYKNFPPFLDQPFVYGKRHVLFLSYYPHVTFVKISAVLRKTGRFHTTLIGACIREDADILSFFDSAYEINDYRELYDIVSRVNVSTIHAASGPWPFGITAVSAARSSGVRTLLEINDSMLFIKHDPMAEECLMERAMIENADGFTHKMPPEALGKMRSIWGIHSPDHEIQALPVRDFFSERSGADHEGPVRLVFAGGLIPYRIAKARGYEGHIFTGLIERLCSCGIDLTFFVNRNARNMFWEEQDVYVEYEYRYPGFHFRKGIPMHDVSRELSGYSFGLYYENRVLSSYNPDHYRYNMATKIFSYLEAGLPVLVPDTALQIADFVRRNGIGIVYRDEDLDDMPRLLEGVDRMGLRDNVIRFREMNSMDGNVDRIADVYGG